MKEVLSLPQLIWKCVPLPVSVFVFKWLDIQMLNIMVGDFFLGNFHDKFSWTTKWGNILTTISKLWGFLVKLLGNLHIHVCSLSNNLIMHSDITDISYMQSNSCIHYLINAIAPISILKNCMWRCNMNHNF